MKTPLKLCVMVTVVSVLLLLLGRTEFRTEMGPMAPWSGVSTQPTARSQRMEQASRLAVPDVLRGVVATPRDWREFTPETIVIGPAAGLELPFHAVKITREPGVTTWVGRSKLPGAGLVGIGKADRWDGVLTLIGGQYDIHIHGEDVKVVEHDNGPISCGAEAPARDYAMSKQTSSPTPQAITGNPAIHTSGTTIYTVELAFFYAKDAETAELPNAGSMDQVASFIDSKYRAYTETVNLVLEQSLVPNLRYHFAGIFRGPDYAPEQKGTRPDGTAYYYLSSDLRTMEDSNSVFGRFVASTCAAHFVDQSVMVAGLQRDASGIASSGEPGVSLAHTAAIDSSTDALTVAHELGHNYGLQHDRETDHIPDTNGGYNFGYAFRYDTGPHGGRSGIMLWGDLMSYGGPTPYYSNPNVRVTGSSFASVYIKEYDGTLYALGIDVGKPKAAYAARTLWEGAAMMAASKNDAALAFPALSLQPMAALTFGPGSTLHLGVTAIGTNLTYQWRKNGTAISGATSATYTKANASANDVGSYDVVVTNALGSVISRASSVSFSDAPVTARLVNISTRSHSGAGNDVQIAGFVIGGSTPKTVLIRAGSAVLGTYGLTGILADPTIELHDRTSTLATDDDWSADAAKADAIRDAAAVVGAAAWASGSKDAAVLTTLNPGAYTVLVKGKNNGAGMAIVEVYEVSEAGGRLVNISTRSPVGTGNDVQIAGFVISGNGPKTVLIRAGSAVLANYGLSGVLADPMIELHDRTSTIATADDWSSDATKAAEIRAAAAQVGAAAWAEGSKDAAILATLSPGAYTAVVQGKNAGTGLAIVEVYDVSP